MAGHTYFEAYYHIVWTAKRREPLISEQIEPAVYGYIRKRCTELGVLVYALDGTENHSHLVCSILPRLAVAEVTEKIKGASSHFINHLPDRGWRLYWQPGYSCLTFPKKDLARVIAYVEDQKRHHAEGTLWASLERLGEELDNEDSPASE